MSAKTERSTAPLKNRSTMKLPMIASPPISGGSSAATSERKNTNESRNTSGKTNSSARGKLASDASHSCRARWGADARRTHYSYHAGVDLVLWERSEAVTDLHALSGGIVHPVRAQPARDGEPEDSSHDRPEHGKAEYGAGMCVEPAGQRLHRFSGDAEPATRGPV